MFDVLWSKSQVVILTPSVSFKCFYSDGSNDMQTTGVPLKSRTLSIRNMIIIRSGGHRSMKETTDISVCAFV